MIANNNDIIKFLKRITIYVPYSNIVVSSSLYNLYAKNSKMFSIYKVVTNQYNIKNVKILSKNTFCHNF